MIVSYLTFNGNTKEAFDFYKSVLGGDYTNLQLVSDTPQGAHMPEADKNKVMHAHLETPIGTLMGNDYFDFTGEAFNPGNNIALSLHPKSVEQAKELFNGLSAGGAVIMPLEKAPWGAYFGMFVDKFGIKWLVNCQEG